MCLPKQKPAQAAVVAPPVAKAPVAEVAPPPPEPTPLAPLPAATDGPARSGARTAVASKKSGAEMLRISLNVPQAGAGVNIPRG